MLEYQKQNCDLTLQEGLECYYDSFPETTEIFGDNNESGTLLRDHDCTHVIFGLDISIEQESILDSWVLWGCKWELKYLLGYLKLPQIKKLYKTYSFKTLLINLILALQTKCFYQDQGLRLTPLVSQFFLVNCLGLASFL